MDSGEQLELLLKTPEFDLFFSFRDIHVQALRQISMCGKNGVKVG